jgi:hypothetical protein
MIIIVTETLSHKSTVVTATAFFIGSFYLALNLSPQIKNRPVWVGFTIDSLLAG